MSIVHRAISAYRSKDFSRALELFESAAKIHGERLFTANIKICKKVISNIIKIDSLEETINSTNQHQSITNKYKNIELLDPATRYMLAKMGEITIGDKELYTYLTEYRALTQKRSEDAVVKSVDTIPYEWPKDLRLAPLPESTNDFEWQKARKAKKRLPPTTYSFGLSVIVPTFNRSNILDITLACLVNQETTFPFEVIVADDGSSERLDNIVRNYESLLDIKYVRQRDYGYQLCAVRNLGLRTSKYEYVAILDCDMAPNSGWVESFMSLLVEDDDVALIGPRKYVDTSSLSAAAFLKSAELIEQLSEVNSPGNHGRVHTDGKSVDWRIDHFKKTEDLRLCDTPFRYFSGGNVAFARKWLDRAGWFDEGFNHWGGEDNEFGYRLYRAGCFFRAVWGAMAFHQEPPGKENETDRDEGKKITSEMVRSKVPYLYRKITPLETSKIHDTPLVSIYIPAYNCAEHIVCCVNSALNQTVVDLEVCICNDGSTDNSEHVILQHFGNNPRVRLLTQSNGGIGRASNAAVRMTRGYYIGQLDSDDYLEPDAVELCLREFLSDPKLACVYTTNRNVRPDGTLIANGYNWPIFSREKLTTAMIAHHFRMFTARAWHLTDGFDENITNAVDFDMYLKLSEVGPFKHLNKISYNRVLHGNNTSIKNLNEQKVNHFKSVNKSFQRQNLTHYEYKPRNAYDSADRSHVIRRVDHDNQSLLR